MPDVPRDYRLAGSGGRRRGSEPSSRASASARPSTARASGGSRPRGSTRRSSRRAASTARGGWRCPPGFPHRPPGLELVADDPPISAQGLDRVDGVLTGCALAIAETGTIVLDSGAESGRRALTLVPDLHVCVVDAARIHASVPDAIAALAPAAAEGRPITLVSGPSATSDIELERVEGVHGPRRLVILVAG